jgi:hypothetical protein
MMWKLVSPVGRTKRIKEEKMLLSRRNIKIEREGGSTLKNKT